MTKLTAVLMTGASLMLFATPALAQSTATQALEAIESVTVTGQAEASVTPVENLNIYTSVSYTHSRVSGPVSIPACRPAAPAAPIPT